jgi:hypothetical protein
MLEHSRRRIRRAAIGVLLAALALPAAANASGGLTAAQQQELKDLIKNSVAFAPEILWTHDRELAEQATASPTDQLANDLIYHGGSILQHPKAYLVFWGKEWADNATVNAGDRTYGLKKAVAYNKDFFSGIGGSAWNAVVKQYCQNIPIGSLSCDGIAGAEHITNPKHQLAGAWIDPSPAPDTIVTSGLAENAVAQDPIAQEAEKASVHFGYDPEAVYLVFTPPGRTATAYGSVYCAYHTQASTIDRSRTLQYAFIPYVPEQGAGCGGDTVNTTNDAYGHDYFDPFSIVAGHEYSEAETDPGNYFSTQDGWNDAQTSENADKCAYTNMHNVTLSTRSGSQFFAVQPTWSNADYDSGNADGGCAG